ncbi:MAG: hypothetical protein U1F39_09085 [Steroidobacteraceae bacterium]
MALIDTLLADRVLERLRAAQGVIGLANRFDPALVEAACQRALDHASPHYRTVKTLLTCKPQLLQAAPIDYRTEPYLSRARFARPARNLFTTHTEGDPA